ncbi:MAG: hypothetical protein V7776_08660 [Halopseudomonas aestusnigri]
MMKLRIALLSLILALTATTSFADPGAFLEITLKINNPDRAVAAGVYQDFKQPFLNQIKGAESKSLLIRDEDVQVLHGFTSEEDANAYLGSKLFNDDVVKALAPILQAAPEVRIYTTN